MPVLTNLFGREGFLTRIDYRKKSTLILASLLEDLGTLYSKNLFVLKVLNISGFFAGKPGFWTSIQTSG